VIHSEMPQQSEGRMRGFQLWINLPAGEKMSAPAYQEFPAEAIPEVADGAARVRVLVGEHAGVRGAIDDPHTEVLYLDVSLAPGAQFEHALAASHNAFVYVFEGDARVADTALATHTLALLGGGDAVAMQAGSNGARFILVAGKPLHEPIVQYGPFVMNTREEIEQAMADYRAGRLVRAAA
jgi:quercetin 2,3-dioxygenase